LFLVIIETVIVIALVGVWVQYRALLNPEIPTAGVPLELEEYQRVSANGDNFGRFDSRVVDSKEDEAAAEEELGIGIRDGTDYEHYSLLISRDYEVNYFLMFLWNHPSWCSHGEDECSVIAICRPEYGERHEGIYIVYRVQQKYIMSTDEYQRNWL